MTKRANLGLKTLLFTNSFTFLKIAIKWCARAKMTKRADLGLKTLLGKNSCTFLKIAKNWCAQCENGKTFRSRDENGVFYKPVHFAKNRKTVVRRARK